MPAYEGRVPLSGEVPWSRDGWRLLSQRGPPIASLDLRRRRRAREVYRSSVIRERNSRKPPWQASMSASLAVWRITRSAFPQAGP